jgi:DNA-binding LytR/AlgR family response regulator
MLDITCIIIEDEPLAVKILTDYISQLQYLRLTKTCKDALEANEYLKDNSPDLIFLDIHLPRLKGIAFLKTLSNPPAVIITTAYHQYAIEGFDMNVTDYLLKPIEFERFLIAVNKVKTTRIEDQQKSGNESKSHAFFTVQKKKVRIMFSDIVYIESQREYIKIVTLQKDYILKMSTNEIESILPSEQFKRIHRSYIVSTNKIESYTAEMVELNGHAIPIGRNYKHIIESL